MSWVDAIANEHEKAWIPPLVAEKNFFKLVRALRLALGTLRHIEYDSDLRGGSLRRVKATLAELDKMSREK